MKRLSQEREALFQREIQSICDASRVVQSKAFCQHGTTSVYQHSLDVAYASCLFVERHRLSVDYKALIRGAFLHDYFLYDWHDRQHAHRRPHGFFHARAAWENAMKDFDLSFREQNIIRRHMFPLTPVPPACLEAWIVCYTDKVCSFRETVYHRKRNLASFF